jgi:hypothetical protein
LLALGQQCNQLFNEADILTKNKLLRFIAPANSVIYDKTLSIKLINTYESFSLLNRKPPEGGETANWCNKLCDLLTAKATELEQDVLFQSLVDTLQLDGSLLAG